MGEHDSQVWPWEASTPSESYGGVLGQIAWEIAGNRSTNSTSTTRSRDRVYFKFQCFSDMLRRTDSVLFKYRAFPPKKEDG